MDRQSKDSGNKQQPQSRQRAATPATGGGTSRDLSPMGGGNRRGAQSISITPPTSSTTHLPSLPSLSSVAAPATSSSSTKALSSWVGLFKPAPSQSSTPGPSTSSAPASQLSPMPRHPSPQPGTSSSTPQPGGPSPFMPPIRDERKSPALETVQSPQPATASSGSPAIPPLKMSSLRIATPGSSEPETYYSAPREKSTGRTVFQRLNAEKNALSQFPHVTREDDGSMHVTDVPGGRIQSLQLVGETFSKPGNQKNKKTLRDTGLKNQSGEKLFGRDNTEAGKIKSGKMGGEPISPRTIALLNEPLSTHRLSGARVEAAAELPVPSGFQEIFGNSHQRRQPFPPIASPSSSSSSTALPPGPGVKTPEPPEGSKPQ
nr:hypothetical protein HUO10_005792 [Paraburkholderia busanensis]